MKFVNLTQHDLIIAFKNGDDLVLPASGEVARVTFSTQQVDEVAGIPIFKTIYEPKITGLPEPEDETIFIVSSLAAQIAKRRDVLAPTKLIRGNDGQVIAAGGFATFC